MNILEISVLALSYKLYGDIFIVPTYLPCFYYVIDSPILYYDLYRTELNLSYVGASYYYCSTYVLIVR